MNFIRPATHYDLTRIAEIEVFNYRLNFYPIFKSDAFYFDELQVPHLIAKLAHDAHALSQTLVYDDGVVKGFIRINGCEIKKLFVEPVLQGQGIGGALLEFAVMKMHADTLWALERTIGPSRFTRVTAFMSQTIESPRTILTNTSCALSAEQPPYYRRKPHVRTDSGFTKLLLYPESG